MRADFSKAMIRKIQTNSRAMLISGDLGFMAFEEIIAVAGNRFLNAGVAEQNMMGVACGLAMSGYQPWVYSIVPFLTLRCLEQIRNDVCFHRLPVRLVGNGGGYTYGIMGSTHHALEDLAVLKALPNMNLLFPCTPDQVAPAVDAMDSLPGPSYLRLGISAFPTASTFIWENPETLTRQYAEGKSLTVLGVGHAAQMTLNAVLDPSIDADVFSIARYPFDWHKDGKVAESVSHTRRVLVVEEHYLPGGMGESLKVSLPCVDHFEILAPSYSVGQLYGSARFHLSQCGLTPETIRRSAERQRGLG